MCDCGDDEDDGDVENDVDNDVDDDEYGPPPDDSDDE